MTQVTHDRLSTVLFFYFIYRSFTRIDTSDK